MKCKCDCDCSKEVDSDLDSQCDDCDNGLHWDSIRNQYVDYNEMDG